MRKKNPRIPAAGQKDRPFSKKKNWMRRERMEKKFDLKSATEKREKNRNALCKQHSELGNAMTINYY